MVHERLEDLLRPQGRTVCAAGAEGSWFSTAAETLSPGDHIASRRCGYWHHGIYAGDGRVVHYAGLSKSGRGGPVEEISLEMFASGRELVLLNNSFSSYRASEIVVRARSRLGERGYNVLTNNCEHFCSWCLTGHSHSAQVEVCVAHPLMLVSVLLKLLRACMQTGARSGANRAAYA